jgi:hypothetical protein
MYCIILAFQFQDTFAFLAITSIITICYSVSYYSILYPEDSELSYCEMERVFGNGFWILFGELSLEHGLCMKFVCKNPMHFISPQLQSKLGNTVILFQLYTGRTP